MKTLLGWVKSVVACKILLTVEQVAPPNGKYCCSLFIFRMYLIFRQLLERVTALKLSTHKIRLFFKKWMDLEQNHGDEKQQNAVCFSTFHFISNFLFY